MEAKRKILLEIVRDIRKNYPGLSRSEIRDSAIAIMLGRTADMTPVTPEEAVGFESINFDNRPEWMRKD